MAFSVAWRPRRWSGDATGCDTLCAALSLRQFGNSTRCFARSASLQSLASQLPEQESRSQRDLAQPWWSELLGVLAQNMHMLHIPPAKCSLLVTLKHLCQGHSMTKELVEHLHIPFGLVNLCSQCLRQCIKETIPRSYTSPLMFITRSCPKSAQRIPKIVSVVHVFLCAALLPFSSASGVSPCLTSCLTMSHHVSPCLTMSHHVSPCFMFFCSVHYCQ